MEIGEACYLKLGRDDVEGKMEGEFVWFDFDGDDYDGTYHVGNHAYYHFCHVDQHLLGEKNIIKF